MVSNDCGQKSKFSIHSLPAPSGRLLNVGVKGCVNCSVWELGGLGVAVFGVLVYAGYCVEACCVGRL